MQMQTIFSQLDNLFQSWASDESYCVELWACVIKYNIVAQLRTTQSELMQ